MFHIHSTLNNCNKLQPDDKAARSDIEDETEKTSIKSDAFCQIALELDQLTALKYTDRRRTTTTNVNATLLSCLAVGALVLIWKRL